MATSVVSAKTQTVQTPSGRIAYTEQGTGPVALFVHGVLLNKHLWRHQLALLSDIRRCIAVDLLAHGETEIAGDQDVSVTANAKMLEQFLDALERGTGGSRRQRQRRRHRADLQRAVPSTRPKPDADRLRRSRQLASGGVQAVSRHGRRRRSAWDARSDAVEQGHLPIASGAWTRIRAPGRSHRREHRNLLAAARRDRAADARPPAFPGRLRQRAHSRRGSTTEDPAPYRR